MKSWLQSALTELEESTGVSPSMLQTALRVALVVGTILFVINHGEALIQGEMRHDDWIFAAITYCVPFSVNLHGQITSRRQLQSSTSES